MHERSGPRAPGELELVRQFVNTLDVEAGTDALGTPASWDGWAEEHDCAGGADDGELERLRAIREAVRHGLLANHDRAPLPEPTRQALEEAICWSGATTQLAADGLRLRAEGTGPRRLAGTVAALVATALTDGTWSRLKACREDSCQWAFFDHSRSRTGQWCSMSVCGNRSKQARLRQRRRADAADPSA